GTMAIAKSLHEVALLRRSEWRCGTVRFRLGNVLPHDFPVPQSASVLPRKALAVHDLALGVGHVVVHGEPVSAGAVVLYGHSLWQIPCLRRQGLRKQGLGKQTECCP